MRCADLILVFIARICFVTGQELQLIFFGQVRSGDELVETQDNATLTDEQAFKFGIYSANKKFFEYGFQFKALTEENNNHIVGPFKAQMSTCSLIGQQALVIFGPKSEEDIGIVQSVCDNKNIAHVLTRWVYDPTDHRSIINFYPHSSYLTSAYLSVMTLWEWKSFTLLYEDNESLLRLGDLLNLAKNFEIIVSVKQLDEEGNGVYRTTLKDAVHSGEKNFVIDCSINILQEVLRQAQQVGLMTSAYNYFITNLDLQTIDLDPFQYSETNITGLRIFDPSSEAVMQKEDDIKANFNPDFISTKMKTETALIIDAVSVLAKVISMKLSFQGMELDEVRCDSRKSSRHGYTISNHVKTSKNMEMTGLIEFDGNGFRSNFNLEVIEIKDSGIYKIGTWNSSKGLVTTRSAAADLENDPNSLRNKTFRVITILTDPYCMLQETTVQLFGNDRFEGFAIDLIQELAKMEGFNFTFLIGKATGVKDKETGKWSGIIGEVLEGRADLAITDLTITSQREEALDFTSPFLNLGISILAKKPVNAPPSFFSFADPFALDTWIMLALSYAVVSFSFFIMGRLCQDEWTNPYPCVEEPEFLINQFSLANSGWFAVGALMQQGTEIAPIAVSTRMLTGMWWFFVLIMVSSYTANLAAFLATEDPVNLFTNIESLVANREKHSIRMGAKENGATEEFFKKSTDETYKKIGEYMETHKEDMVKENKDGVKLAEEETYAFFMESTAIDYETQRHCTLKQYGGLLDDKGYGIAMRKNSTYRTKLSTAILKLQNSGELDKLKRKWWEEKRGGGLCNPDGEEGKTPALGVQNVQGVFYVTIGGTFLAVFVVIAEFLISSCKIKAKTKLSFGEALKNETKTFLDFNNDVKPAIKEKSQSGSKSSKDSGTSYNNMAPAAPYGFIPTITKEELKD